MKNRSWKVKGKKKKTVDIQLESLTTVKYLPFDSSSAF